MNTSNVFRVAGGLLLVLAAGWAVSGFFVLTGIFSENAPSPHALFGAGERLLVVLFFALALGTAVAGAFAKALEYHEGLQ